MSASSKPNLAGVEWPCATAPSDELPERLVATLYRLLRDHVAPGDMEQVLLDIGKAGTDPVSYSNPHLEGLARALATYLVRY